MLQKIETYIERNKLIHQDAKIIVALSGGADSVALLDVLLQLKYNCIAAHCNFHLRGEESDRDALFVKKLCKDYNIELHINNFDTRAYAASNSISIEMAARELRYNWFEKIRRESQADYIAVAHHRDDSIETILLNFIRGTGIRGLTGIPPKNEFVIRPLLSVSRDEILKYLDKRDLFYVNDSTNNEDIYTRNKIRLKVLPLLETINPSIRNTILSTSEHLSQVEHVYSDYLQKAKQRVFDGKQINIDLLRKQIEPKALLFEILYSYGFNGDVVKQIYFSLDHQSGKQFYSESHKLVKDREYLLLSELNQVKNLSSYSLPEEGIEIPIVLKVEKIHSSEFCIEKNPDVLYLDYSKISFPLTLRKWSRGDWFIPFGMRGRKKISDYFSDNKFSVLDKENTWLLCNEKDIIWIVGHRSDDRYKISDSTDIILKITLLENL